MWKPEDNLISSEDLHGLLGNPQLVIADSRSDLLDKEVGFRQYRESHIPNAMFVSVDEDLADPPGRRGRHPLPSKERFADFLGRSGISNESHVVVYDGGNGMFVCRLWWMLRWLGHEKVSVLDGGFAGWQEAGFETATDIPVPKPTEFAIGTPLTRTVTAEEVLNHRGVLVDARAEDRFQGFNETMDHTAGHIPGAICSPFLKNIGSDGKFTRNPNKFEGVSKDADVICYCGSGVTATNNILAMLVSGFDEPALYPGSWSEWIEDPSRPKVPE